MTSKHPIEIPPPNTPCATCATLLREVKLDESFPVYDEKDEKYFLHLRDRQDRHVRVDCCGRWVCWLCIERNPRFATYCPFCPIKRPSSTEASTSSQTNQLDSAAPPPYSELNISPIVPPPPYPSSHTGALATNVDPRDSLVHYLGPTDTLPTVSLKYSTPLPILRSYNRLFSDSLLPGRSFLLIPRAYYSGPSLSPDPIQSEEENILKRFQIKTKCVEYDVAKVYLEEAGGDLDKAVDKWKSDERWEETNSIPRSLGSKGKGKEMIKVRNRGFFR